MSSHAWDKPLSARKLSLFLGVFFVLLFFASEAMAGSPSFLIRPQTKLKLAIVEWISSTGEYKEWTALNGEYTVSPAGTISIPLIGEIEVMDQTTAAVEKKIGAALKDKTGLATVPVASVEITKYPMIYVTGAVDRSGELEFRPGMTAIQAVAMAGGRERKQIPTGGYSEVDQIRYLGELNRYQTNLKQLMAKKSRLQAELSGAPAIQTPPELGGGSAEDKQIMAAEARLFQARMQALTHQLDAFKELGDLLKREIAVLDEKMGVQERQISIAEADLKVVSKLVETKALVRSQQSNSERLVADLKSNMLDLVVASMRAKQKLSETERDALTLKGQYTIEAGRDLQGVESDLGDIRLKRDTTLQVLQITGAALQRVDDPKLAELQPVEYWITRSGDNQKPFKADQSTQLMPGDMLDVRLTINPGSEGGQTVAQGQTQ